ncbi:VWA domain-containing protein [Streptomyces brasiliensis]|uniref:VWFA domain-containing protein n=1 Tax=Streptomyces brasiliensis TaxID=1954 RepID=A0A917KIY2_9ACTN|nr:VWA domain-containing protein [Streptomyces brasiliensis]GGJ16092.1 hypothetical protein GCM10010121_028480 [Streptomyces brasiliensis]
MGILTLLRNAFGRSRKGQTAEPEGADRLPTQEPTPTPRLPEPRKSEPDEHELVAAAFDNVTVPAPAKQRPAEPDPEAEPTAEAEPEIEPTAEDAPASEPVAEAEPEIEPTAEDAPASEPVAEDAPASDAGSEPVAEAEPVAEVASVTDEQPEPELSSEPLTEPEPVAEAEPVSVPEPEPVSEPEPAQIAEVTAEPEPTAEVTTAPEPTTEATPEPEPTPEVVEESTPVAEVAAQPEPATTEPEAADGEAAPQGPPAPDDESSTGGAGGNTDRADGEAEVIDTAKLPQGLVTAYNAATTTLTDTHLTGTRAKLYLVLDRSASMRPYYKDGSAQSLAEQTLALAAHLDPAPRPTVHVVFFSTEVDGTTDLTLTDHENKIDEVHASLGRMGRTSYHAAVEAVLTHHQKEHDPATPALVVFQTDGAPDAKTPATQSLTDAAKTNPSVFFSFVAFGEHDNKAFDYLRKLKTPNTSFFHAGPTPRELTDTELYEGVLASWRP